MQAAKERRERKPGKPGLDAHALRKELILQKNVAHNAGVANFMCAAARAGSLLAVYRQHLCIDGAIALSDMERCSAGAGCLLPSRPMPATTHSLRRADARAGPAAAWSARWWRAWSPASGASPAGPASCTTWPCTPWCALRGCAAACCLRAASFPCC